MRGRHIGTAVLVVLLLGAMLSLGTMTANAHPTDVNVTHLFTNQQGKIIGVGGFINCSHNSTFALRVNVGIVGDRMAVGRASGNCTGQAPPSFKNAGPAGGQGTNGGTQWVTSRLDNAAGITCATADVARGSARTSDGGTLAFNDTGYSCGDI